MLQRGYKGQSAALPSLSRHGNITLSDLVFELFSRPRYVWASCIISTHRPVTIDFVAVERLTGSMILSSLTLCSSEREFRTAFEK